MKQALLLASTLLPCVPSAAQSAPAATYPQITVRQYPAGDPAIPRAVRDRLDRPAQPAFADRGGRLWRVTAHGLIEREIASGRERTLTGRDGLPIQPVTALGGTAEGELWLATGRGAILYRPDAEPDARWYYFAGRRYLADDEVLAIAAGHGGAWIRTRRGVSRIEFTPFTLERKSRLFLDRIRLRHNRHGYTATSALLRAGEPASLRMESTDNDGLWTSIYLAAETLRYRATGSPEALANARTALAAMLRLVSITGIPGFPARSLVRRGEPLPRDGEWHPTGDGEWWWKGDTSSDELVGHLFAYWVAWRYLPGHGDPDGIRAAVRSIVGGLLDHGLQLRGYQGRVTTWGRWNPEYEQTLTARDRALDSLEILSHLRVAYAITGEPRFLEAYRHIGGDLRYLEYIRHFDENLDPHEVNYSDEELAFLSFFPLLEAETDPDTSRTLRSALAVLWGSVRAEHNPLWSLLYRVGAGAGEYDCREVETALERIPLDTISWTVSNSARDDLTFLPVPGRSREAMATRSIPPNERPVMKWNGNPYAADGGDGGRSEDDGAFFLLPYWVGRAYGLLPCGREGSHPPTDRPDR